MKCNVYLDFLIKYFIYIYNIYIYSGVLISFIYIFNVYKNDVDKVNLFVKMDDVRISLDSVPYNTLAFQMPALFTLLVFVIVKAIILTMHFTSIDIL